MGPIIVLIVTIVIISAVVGAIAQFLNKLSEMNNAPARRPNGGNRAAAPAPVRQSDREMDRFLAEIDRLRKKGDGERPAGKNEAATVPVARPVKPSPERPRTRVAAEPVAEPRSLVPTAFVPTQAGPPPRMEDIPPAAVVTRPTPLSAPLAPAPRVSRIAERARPAPKTPLARNLTDLLNSGQGVAMAVILQEIFGPPKCKK